MTNNLLLVFAKTPITGTVKTRLAEEIGATKALWVYKQLLKKTDAVINQVQAKVVVFYTGTSVDDFRTVLNKFDKKPQMGEDLGERMTAAFRWGFAKGYSKIAIIGTDLWELDSNTIEQAFNFLTSHEVVLGPATDGGYYLLGMSKFIPEAFKKKKWGSATVASDTLKDLHTYRVGFLTEKNDIDNYQDLLNCKQLFSQYKTQFYESKN